MIDNPNASAMASHKVPTGLIKPRPLKMPDSDVTHTGKDRVKLGPIFIKILK